MKKLEPKKRKPAKTRTTPRQRAFVSGLLAGKSQSEAARAAGYAESTARHADRILNKPSVQQKFSEFLEAAGISDEKLAQRLREGIDAHETKFFANKGVVTDERTVVDLGTRA